MEVNKKELEKLLFIGITSDANLLALISSKFNPNIFTDKSLQQISTFYVKFYERYNRIPNEAETKLFYDRFSQFKETLETLTTDTDYHSIDKELLYAEFEKLIKERSALLVIQDIITDISGNKKDALNAEKIVTTFEGITNFSLCDFHVFDAQKDTESYYQAITDSDKRLSTGFKAIDNLTGGGILADGKFLGVVFAETNMGKSIMLTNLANNCVRQGKNALVISLELSETLYATRAYADLYDLPISRIQFMEEELCERIQSHIDYGKLYIKEFPPASMTVEEISGFIEILINRGYHFDLVCVDYLTLLTTATKADNSNEAGKEISRKLRALTYKFSFPIMTAAQLNRGGFDSVPSNKNAAEAIAIPQECDFAIGLYQQAEDKEQNIMRVKCTKSRLGSNDWTVALRYNKENLRFESMNDSGDELALDSPQVDKSVTEISDVLDGMEIDCPF